MQCKQIIRIILLLSVVILTGCRHASQIELLTRAEAFLPETPDSADIILSSIDVAHLYDEEEVALYALLRPMTDAILGTDAPADSLIKQAYRYYASHSGKAPSNQVTMQRFAKAALYMGDWFAAKDSIKACEDCYRTAIRVSEKCKDWHTCYISNQRLAKQVHWSNEEEALTLIDKAIGIYAKCRDNVANLLALYDFKTNYLTQIDYFHNGDFKPALEQANKEYQLAKDSQQAFYENLALSSLAKIYWAKHDYHTALKHAVNIKLTDSLDEPMINYFNDIIAQCYLSCDSVEQAKQIYQTQPAISDKTLAYLSAKALAKIAIQYDERDSALSYLDSAFTCSEAMYFDALKAKDDYYQDNLKKEKEQERLQYEGRLKSWLFGGGLFILLFSGCLIGRVFVLRARMHKERNKHLQHELQLMQERQEAQADALLKKTAAIKYLRKFIIEQTDAALKLKDGTPYSKLRPKDWTDVENLLNDIDNRRIFKIRERYPDLSSDEIHLCIMVRLGMSNPEIGKVFCLTSSAIQRRKLTLKKNKFGVTDSDRTLNDCIESL